MKNVYGIDIAKKSFEVFVIHSDQSHRSSSFENTESGIKSFLKWVKRKSVEGDSIFLMEASGVYYLRLALKLFQSAHCVKVLNPLVIRRFSQMNLKRTKTDRQDAQIIANYGIQYHAQLPDWQPPQKYAFQLRQLITATEQLQKQLSMSHTLLEALCQNPLTDQWLIEQQQSLIEVLQKQLKRLDKQVEKIILAHYEDTYKAILSIPGVGPKTASLFIAITHNFTRFESQKQLASFIGVCPRIFQSGTSVKAKERIVKMGQPLARKLLYMAALTTHVKK